LGDGGLSIPDIDDLDLVDRLSHGRVDLTYGRCKKSRWIICMFTDASSSALDIFGGRLVEFDKLVEKNMERENRLD
jgi:phosphoribosylformimino-5-aminoimidazole carboxamide ribotide isomerase